MKYWLSLRARGPVRFVVSAQERVKIGFIDIQMWSRNLKPERVTNDRFQLR